MKKTQLLTALAAGLLMCAPAWAVTGDPCQSYAVSRQSTPISFPGPNPTSFDIRSTGAKGIHVCGFTLQSQNGVSLYTTNADSCSAGFPNPVTGYFKGTVTSPGNGTVFEVPPNSLLCVSDPTTDPVDGMLIYTEP
jgi:hypothetical protein